MNTHHSPHESHHSMTCRRIDDQRGAALIFAVISIIGVGITSMVFLSTSLASLETVRTEYENERAFQNAEVALSIAIAVGACLAQARPAGGVLVGRDAEVFATLPFPRKLGGHRCNGKAPPWLPPPLAVLSDDSRMVPSGDWQQEGELLLCAPMVCKLASCF